MTDWPQANVTHKKRGSTGQWKETWTWSLLTQAWILASQEGSKMRSHTVVVYCHGFFHCKMRVTITVASLTINEKQINNIGSNTTDSGLYSNFCWTWYSIPLASSHVHFNWLPWMSFYFIINEHWLSVIFTFFFILSVCFTFSTWLCIHFIIMF